MKFHTIRWALLTVLLAVMTACASSHVLVGTARDPIDWEDVKVYLDAPLVYENVALLEASDLGANGFSAQSRMNKVMSRLRAEAADLGANGILLQGFDTQVTGAVSSGFGNATYSGNSAFVTGTGYSAAQTSKIGRAVAIFVPANGTAAAAPPAAPEPPTAQPVDRPAAQPSPLQPVTSPTAAPSSTVAPHPATSSNSTAPASSGSSWRRWGQKGE